jgi:hypothetical protein
MERLLKDAGEQEQKMDGAMQAAQHGRSGFSRRYFW